MYLHFSLSPAVHYTANLRNAYLSAHAANDHADAWPG